MSNMSEDEVFAALADRLDVAAAQPLAVAALSSPPLAKRLLAALLDLATGPDKGQQAATAALAKFSSNTLCASTADGERQSTCVVGDMSAYSPACERERCRCIEWWK